MIDTDLIDSRVIELCELVKTHGGKAYMTGGCVRDSLLGFHAKDFDIEVFGIDAAPLKALLSTKFTIDIVGESFGIIKIKGTKIDVGLPRKEEKTGDGHKAFDVVTDSSLTVEQAAQRRDFTINAIYFDPLTGEVQDPCHGILHLQHKLLVHVSDKFFEDPLRIFRAMKFIARFDLTPSVLLVDVCTKVANMDKEMKSLSPERIFEEFNDLILKGHKISKGLNFLKTIGALWMFRELYDLIGIPQEPQWHPEGDVWTHTGLVMDAFAEKVRGMYLNPFNQLLVGYAALCHDIGKPATTINEDGKIKSPAHDVIGAELTPVFLRRLTNNTEILEIVPKLVKHHMRVAELYVAKAGKTAYKRLAVACPRLDLLHGVYTADVWGRPPIIPDTSAGAHFLEMISTLNIEKEAPKPLVQGRHLIPLGVQPGKRMGLLLKEIFELQLDGVINTPEEGIEYFNQHLKNKHEVL